MKPKVLITRKILPEALEYLKKHTQYDIGGEKRNLTKKELLEKIKDKEGILTLLVDQIDREVMDQAPSLKIIANCAVGYNNIDIGYAKQKGIMVTNTPGILTETTADLTMALIMAVSRKIVPADAFTRRKNFKGWEIDLFLGKEVTGKRLGIIGMGRIGKAVALRAQGFRMDTVYSDPRILTPEEENKYKAAYLPLDELLSTSDIVTIHTVLNSETHHLVSKHKLSLMKKDAILVNVSRGPVVEERALAEALEKKQIWGAGLDVYEREPEIEEKLYSLDNAVLLPHIGSATYETRLKMSMMAAKNLVQGLQGETPDNLVTQ
ncbi:D-glycerate dehydrogenase [bacterium]|nr:D-glycerate dehydrogenase [bacterium]